MTELPRNLSGKAVTSHYTLLAGDERFRLAVEASARGDGDELARLRDTASMRAYKVTDPDYLDRIDASREIATALALFVGPRLAELRMLRNTRDTLAGPVAVAVAARVRASVVSDSDEISAEDAVLAATQSIAERFTAAEAELTADVAATYAGFAVVCREEMGLEPSVVLRAHLDPLPIVEQLDALDAEPHREATDRWSETFRRAWRAYTDVGVGPRPR